MSASTRSLARVYWISEQHPLVEIELTLRIELLSPEYHMVRIGTPSAIPDKLLDALWVKGLCNGVHAAIRDLNFSLSGGDVGVDIVQLNISESLEAFTEYELERLSRKLTALAREGVDDLLTSMTHTGAV